MLLGHARLVTIWCEASRRMEPFSRKTRNVGCEASITLLALNGEGLTLSGMVNVSESS